MEELELSSRSPSQLVRLLLVQKFKNNLSFFQGSCGFHFRSRLCASKTNLCLRIEPGFQQHAKALIFLL